MDVDEGSQETEESSSAVSASTAMPCSSSMSSISKLSSLSSASASKSESESESAVVSLLDRLKCPQPSELSPSRKVHCNPPPKGRKRSSGERGRNDPHIPPSKRVHEYPNEQLTVSAGRLFCFFVYLIVFSQCCVAYFQAL